MSSVTDTNITLDITSIGEITPNLFGEAGKWRYFNWMKFTLDV